jgi:NADH-quinone oxidoreductase subunit G
LRSFQTISRLSIIMPRLIIDGYEIEVPGGTKVIEAAERLGIVIPRFCYHPGLGSLGACRVCAVKFLEGPVKGVEMSCMTDACDGMVVSTTDPEAMEFRKYVIEWLMLHHPHDCPVCDEGGHCLLQDETVSGGHGIRRYQGKKRTYHDQYLGEFVQHEMNRCIHCFRCRRFYQEFAGYRDFGALQIANRMYFGRFSNGPLESPFSGNLIDVCPTGVLTDKPSRYKARRWDYERAPSLCIHCSLGCSTVGSARYREMIRLEARLHEAVNGHFICDRGRYGFQYAGRLDRPRQARIGGEGAPRSLAVEKAAEKLTQVIKTHGSQAVACASSTRCSLETMGQLMRLSRHMGWREPGLFMDSASARKTRQAVSRLDSRLVVSMREAEQADFILAVAADPVNEAPMLALAMRQAFRKGARVAVIDPRPISLPLSFEPIPVSPGNFHLCLGVLIRHALSGEDLKEAGPEALAFHGALPDRYGPDSSLHDRLVRLGEELRQSRRPIVICGTDVALETTPDFAADCASLLRAAKKEARLLYTFPGPNAFGAALLSRADHSFSEILSDIDKGGIKALLMVEADPFTHFPDRQRLIEAINRLELLILMDYLPTPSAERAHVLIPTATLFETDSCWVNHEGRLQKASVVHRGGAPIRQVSGGSHPPRLFDAHAPGDEVKSPFLALAELGAALSPHESEFPEKDVRLWLAEENPLFTGISSLDSEDSGIRVISDQGQPDGVFSGRVQDRTQSASQGEGGLELLLVDWTFGTEELSSFSAYTEKAEKSPQLMIQSREASRLGLSDGDRVVLRLAGGPLEVAVQTDDRMASGVIVMPRHHKLTWQRAGAFTVRLSADQIERI